MTTAATAPDYMQCRPEIVGGLIEIASDALMSTFPTLKVDPYDIELMLDALRVLRPRVSEIQMLEGVLHMARGHWDDAILALREVCEIAPNFSYAKALLAYCLSSKGDAEWRIVANDVMANQPTPDSATLMKALQAREDLASAAQASVNGETFVTPASVTALVEESSEPQAEAAAPNEPAAGVLPYDMALRA